jgi:hypothetical protein
VCRSVAGRRSTDAAGSTNYARSGTTAALVNPTDLPAPSRTRLVVTTMEPDTIRVDETCGCSATIELEADNPNQIALLLEAWRIGHRHEPGTDRPAKAAGGVNLSASPDTIVPHLEPGEAVVPLTGPLGQPGSPWLKHELGHCRLAMVDGWARVRADDPATADRWLAKESCGCGRT